MDTFNIGDKVKVLGSSGWFNTGTIVRLNSEDELALIEFLDNSTEWFSFISLTKSNV